MSKLEELIKELCPNGVRYERLDGICHLVTGATPSKTNPAYWSNGTISWMSSGEVNLKYIWKTEQKCVAGRRGEESDDPCHDAQI